MRIRNRATAIRAISQSRARRTGRARILSGTKANKNASSQASNKYANSLINSQTGNTNTSQVKQYYIYEELEKTAEGLQEHAKALLKMGEAFQTEETEQEEESKTLTPEEEAIKEQAQKENVISYVKKLVNTYNIVSEDLVDSKSSTNKIFSNQLKSIVSGYEKKLNEVGITIQKDGQMSVDSKEIAQADFNTLKSIFSDPKGLSKELKDKCETIQENAATSLRMLNRMYGSSLTYNKYGISNAYNNSYGKYSAWG